MGLFYSRMEFSRKYETCKTYSLLMDTRSMLDIVSAFGTLRHQISNPFVRPDPLINKPKGILVMTGIVSIDVVLR